MGVFRNRDVLDGVLTVLSTQSTVVLAFCYAHANPFDRLLNEVTRSQANLAVVTFGLAYALGFFYHWLPRRAPQARSLSHWIIFVACLSALGMASASWFGDVGGSALWHAMNLTGNGAGFFYLILDLTNMIRQHRRAKTTI